MVNEQYLLQLRCSISFYSSLKLGYFTFFYWQQYTSFCIHVNSTVFLQFPSKCFGHVSQKVWILRGVLIHYTAMLSSTILCSKKQGQEIGGLYNHCRHFLTSTLASVQPWLPDSLSPDRTIFCKYSTLVEWSLNILDNSLQIMWVCILVSNVSTEGKYYRLLALTISPAWQTLL